MKRIGFIKGNRCDFKDGFIVVPPRPIRMNLAEPDIYVQSLTPLYPIGTLLWYPGMGKKYRYSKAGADLTGTKVLVINGHYVPDALSYPNDGGFFGHCQEDGAAVGYDAGATVIYVTGTQNTPKNFYEGGHLVHFETATGLCYEDSYIISGPDEASTTPWRNQKITLYKPKKYAIVALDGIEIWCNPYSHIVSHDTPGYTYYSTSMGVPPIPVDEGYYFWLQTAGPVLITPDGWGANCPGFAVDTREVRVHKGGGIVCASTSGNASDQVIGTLLSATEAGSADAFVNMDLDLGH